MGINQIIKNFQSQNAILKWTALAVFTLVFAGCQPRDVDPRYGTVEAGKVGSVVTNFRDVNSPSKAFNFTADYLEVKDQPGEQLSTCASGSWNDIRMYDRNNKDLVYKSIYAGERVAVLAAASNCHKVGMRVLISSTSDGRGSNYGHAVVTKLMLIDRNALTAEMLTAMDMTTFSLNSMLRDAQTASILVFKYVKGSAPQEEKFLNADVALPSDAAPGTVGSIVESFADIVSPSKNIVVPVSEEAVVKIGGRLSNCPLEQWTDVRVYDKFEKERVFKDIYSGKRTGILAFPKNCHTVGMRVVISSTTEGRSSHYGEAVITGIYLIKKEDIIANHLEDVDYKADNLNNYLKDEPIASVVTFKYIKGSAAQEAQYLDGLEPVIVTEPRAEEPLYVPIETTETYVLEEPTVVTTTPIAPSGTVPGVYVQVGENNTGSITIVIEGGTAGQAPSVHVTGGEASVVVVDPAVSAPPSTAPRTQPSAIATPNSDPLPESFVQNLEALGQDIQVIEYLNRKAVLKTCLSGRPWTEFRSFRKLDPQMIAGQRTMAISKGKGNCYQPSDVVSIYSPDGVPYAGEVLIKEVFVMKASDLTDEIIAATAQTRAEVEAFIGSEPIINVTVFEYLPKTAAIDSEITDETGAVAVVVEGAVAFRPGQILKTCDVNAELTLAVSEAEQEMFATSLFRKAFVTPKTPCWSVGSSVSLVSQTSGQPVLDQLVRLVRVEVKPISSLTEDELAQLGFLKVTDLISSLSQEWGRAVPSDFKVTLLSVRN